MKGDATLPLLLLLSMRLPGCCTTAAGFSVNSTWSSPSGRSVEGLSTTLLPLLQAKLFDLLDEHSASRAVSVAALLWLLGLDLLNRPPHKPSTAEDNRLLPASDGRGVPADEGLRLACKANICIRKIRVNN
jgi:hypothetical protein